MRSSRAIASGRDAGDRLDDLALVERACSGDRDAEAAIYRRHVPYIAGLATRLLASATEAEDVVQDTFIIAFADLARKGTITALRPWLARIAVSQVHRRFRRRKLLRLLGIDRAEPAQLDAIASPETSPEVRAQLAALGRVLESLPPAQRIAWSLRCIEGATLDEVAAACGCSLATAKRRIAAAWERVRANVEIAEAAVAVPLGRESAGGEGTT